MDKEFWVRIDYDEINKKLCGLRHVDFYEKPGYMQVIEKSAYDSISGELAVAKIMLEKEKAAYDELKEKISKEMKKIHEGSPSEWAYKILEKERDELLVNFQHRAIKDREDKRRYEEKLAIAVEALEKIQSDKINIALQMHIIAAVALTEINSLSDPSSEQLSKSSL